MGIFIELINKIFNRNDGIEVVFAEELLHKWDLNQKHQL